MKIVKGIIIVFGIIAIFSGIYINVVYNNMDDLTTETKLRILTWDVKNSKNIFINNGFNVKTDDFVYSGTVLTSLTYSTNDLEYDINCNSTICFILGEKPFDVRFCVNVDGDEYTVYYNHDNITYSKEFLDNAMNIFSEKVDTTYKEYTDTTYTDEHKNKLHYFFQYLAARLKL